MQLLAAQTMYLSFFVWFL